MAEHQPWEKCNIEACRKNEEYRTFLKDFRSLHKDEEQDVIIFIKLSLEKVRNQLIAAGWEPEICMAKYHYDFIMREVSKMESTSITIERTRDHKNPLINLAPLKPIEAVQAMMSISQGQGKSHTQSVLPGVKASHFGFASKL